MTMDFNRAMAAASMQRIAPHTEEGRQHLAKASAQELQNLRSWLKPWAPIRVFIADPWLIGCLVWMALATGAFFGSQGIALALVAGIGTPVLLLFFSVLVVRRHMGYLMLRELSPGQLLKAQELKARGGPLAEAYFDQVSKHRSLVVADTFALAWLAREGRVQAAREKVNQTDTPPDASGVVEEGGRHE